MQICDITYAQEFLSICKGESLFILYKVNEVNIEARLQKSDGNMCCSANEQGNNKLSLRYKE